MEPMGKNSEKTRLILSAVYKGREEANLSPQWQGQVMDVIRALPAKAVLKKTTIKLERTVWRLAPVACVLIVAMAVVLLSQDFSPQYGLIEAMMDDSVDTLLAQAMGMQ
ncbi:MAG: hypothetical protein JEZ02_08050 [Desulfatibacillum sp.]|nr:hypothetical protein [Desulfatibacillum sp.]